MLDRNLWANKKVLKIQLWAVDYEKTSQITYITKNLHTYSSIKVTKVVQSSSTSSPSCATIAPIQKIRNVVTKSDPSPFSRQIPSITSRPSVYGLVQLISVQRIESVTFVPHLSLPPSLDLIHTNLLH